MDKLRTSFLRILIVSAFATLMLIFISEASSQDVIRTESETTSTITTNGNTTTTLKSPPASAITPTINTSNSDLCTFGVAGAVQTQFLESQRERSLLTKIAKDSKMQKHFTTWA